MSASDRKSGVVIPQTLRWHGELAAAAGYGLTRLLGSTWRMDLEDASNALAEIASGPVIFSLWHNRLALSIPVYRHFFLTRQPRRRLAALVSASKDGAILARVLEHHGVQPVRGSSSRRGGQAMLELTTWAARGYDIAITPDGPRGPRCEVQEGAVMLAQACGLPIVPISATIDWKSECSSWDAFQFPYPFTRCHIRVDELVRVKRDADDIERETARRILQERMDAMSVADE